MSEGKCDKCGENLKKMNSGTVTSTIGAAVTRVFFGGCTNPTCIEKDRAEAPKGDE